MPSAIPAPVSASALWGGRILTVLPVLLLLLSGVMKLLRPVSVVEGFARYGYPGDLIIAIGMLEIACTVVYAIPRTAILGAILLTGYLGGATATNLRIGDPSFIATAVLGMMVWGGLYLRDERLRKLMPLRS